MSAYTHSQKAVRPRSARRIGAIVLAGFMLLMLLIQLVPYGREHTNPSVIAEPAWDSPQTRAIFFRACADCHSNETKWPWYSNIAPASWLITRDVMQGREEFNVSEWGRPDNEGDDAAKLVQNGEMPPWFYLPLHPEANLSPVERQQLINGLLATFGGDLKGGEDD